MQLQQLFDIARRQWGIASPNAMQQQALQAWSKGGDVALYSPTGTGKTLAFAWCALSALPDEAWLPPGIVVISPSRELAMQTAETMRQLGQGLKTTLCCGGHAVSDEQASLSMTPDVIVATPGRLLDHANRGHIDLSPTQLLVIDEVDKSLELGFEDEMRSLVRLMPCVRRRFITSATRLLAVPAYLGMRNTALVDVLPHGDETPTSHVATWQVRCPSDGERLQTLAQLLLSLPPDSKSIVFVETRDQVDVVAQWLIRHGVEAGAYHGTMRQQDREMTVARLNNGSLAVMVATDLAARGLDIDTVTHVVHYSLPGTREAYVHRNGRTGRMGAGGEAFVITTSQQQLPLWMAVQGIREPHPARAQVRAAMVTLYFQAGKKEKLSRGDIMGFVAQHSGLAASDVGRIDVRDHYSLVAIPRQAAAAVLQRLQLHKIKGRRVRISELQ